MHYKSILALVVMVGTLSVFEIRSEQMKSEGETMSLCESPWVVEQGLPDAITERFKNVGTKLNESNLTITSISQSPSTTGPVVLCHASLRYKEKRETEHYLIDYIVNQSNGQNVVTVSRINYL